MLDGLIKEGYSAEDIAQITGRHPVAVRRMLPAGYKPTKHLDTPYGLTDKTDALRVKLGGIIASMTEKGLSRKRIGELTGLNKRQSYAAERRPFNYDYTLSQIERVLAYDTTTNRHLAILEANAKDEG